MPSHLGTTVVMVRKVAATRAWAGVGDATARRPAPRGSWGSECGPGSVPSQRGSNRIRKESNGAGRGPGGHGGGGQPKKV